MVLTNNWKEIPEVNMILMFLLDGSKNYLNFPIRKSNWTRINKGKRKDDYLIRLEKELKYITKTNYIEDARKRVYTIKKQKYVKEIIRSILKEVNVLVRDERKRNKELINSKEIQEFIERYISLHRDVILMRENKKFPSFNELVKHIMESIAFIDKKLYFKYLNNDTPLSIFIHVCHFSNGKSEIETANYTLLNLYGSGRDKKDYNKRRSIKGVLRY